MKTANVGGRLAVVRSGAHFDVEAASGGRFSSDPMVAFEVWGELRDWAESADLANPLESDQMLLESPVPRPLQVFGIGLNYRSHAIESGLPIPEVPLVFTKFPSSVSGPIGDVLIPTPQTDWEVELAVVIGTTAFHVDRSEAWNHVAGVTLAQDFSARNVQLTPAGTPQFSLGKSFPGFLPMGPLLVTIDDLDAPDAIHLWCDIDGLRVQQGNTSDLIFSVPVLIEYLSSVLPLGPGDVILTGTPAGVGIGPTPPTFLTPGQITETGSLEIGVMRHRAVSSPAPWAWTP